MAGTMTKQELVADLVNDLADEQGSLLRVLGALDDADWHRATPAVGWTIHDQVAHLAHFDFITRLAVAEPHRFITVRDSLEDLQTYVDLIGPANLSRNGADMTRWWEDQGEQLREAVLARTSQQRVPWFGPAMSLASKVTARIMETWAHGQDVVDSLGIKREPSRRLRHVARIGVLAFPHSFLTRGRDVPSTPVAVRLQAVDGEEWTWGPDDATEVVSGPIEDFCLVVTQRRHVGDTRVRTTGPVAEQWMQIAQAFAGPAGNGRRPGQFKEERRRG